MFEPVTKEIFRWSLTDPEFGEAIVGHLYMKDGKVALFDPPATEKLFDLVRILGKPEAVFMTSYHHKRGSLHAVRVLKIPLYVPDLSGMELSTNKEYTGAKKYGPKTRLPMNLKAHVIKASIGSNSNFTEMGIQVNSFLLVGDSAWASGNYLNFFPTGIMPDTGGKMASSVKAAIKGIVKSAKIKGLLSGHGEDLREGLEQALK